MVANKKEAEQLIKDSEQAPVGPRNRETAEADQGKLLVPVIIKADVTGSIEAIIHELKKVSHEHVALNIVADGVGTVSEGDVKTAQAGGAMIIAFHVGVDQSARELAERAGVPIEVFSIIYDLENRVKEILAERAPKVRAEEILGNAKLLKVFNASGGKQVIGARLDTGFVKLGDLVKIDRRGVPLGMGKVTNLQQARADVKEIRTEGEFGAQIETKVDIANGDTFTFYQIKEG